MVHFYEVKLSFTIKKFTTLASFKNNITKLNLTELVDRVCPGAVLYVLHEVFLRKLINFIVLYRTIYFTKYPSIIFNGENICI